MCTLSWFFSQDGYHLMFNRDEQRSRSKALLPQLSIEQGTRRLMPIDPDGGGSWIAVNEYGLAICLLNYYQGSVPENISKSRGQLVKRLSVYSSGSDIVRELNTINLSAYAPFTLVVFSDQAAHQQSALLALCWTGNRLEKVKVASPLTSSSVAFNEVNLARQKRYHQFNPKNTADLVQFHCSHQPSAKGRGYIGHQSVCMHRADASTVSLTHIEVSAGAVEMNYLDASPCSLPLATTEGFMQASSRSLLLRSTKYMSQSAQQSMPV